MVIGARGSGKSVLARRLVERARAAGRGAVIVDPALDLRVPGGYAAALHDDLGLAVRHLRRGGVILLRPPVALAVPGYVSAACILASQARCGLVIDEAHLAMTRGRPHPDLLDMITAARHRGVSVCLVTQAPQGLRGLGLHSGAVLYCFALPMGGPWLRAYGLPAEAWDRLAQAPAHSFLRLDPDGRLAGPFRLVL